MARFARAAHVYDVAALFRTNCLIEGSSLLWPDEHVWTVENLGSLYNAFMDDPDLSEDTFYTKWQRQLNTLPAAMHRIAADIIVFYHLFPLNIGADRKLADVRTVISWKLAEESPDLANVQRAFTSPVGRSGPSYLLRRPWQIAFYLEFSRRIRSGEADPEDYVACKLLADKVQARVQKCGEARHIVLHLLFPDEFERIASSSHKKEIIGKFLAEAGSASDPDDALKNIREKLSARYDRPEIDSIKMISGVSGIRTQSRRPHATGLKRR